MNFLFHNILSKPIPQWILATETAMMQIYHTVNENTKRKINSIAYFNKTYKNPRPLDIGTFVLKGNFLHVHFSDKLKPLRIGSYKIIHKISDITYEIVNQDGYTSHIQRNHLFPDYPKEPKNFLLYNSIIHIQMMIMTIITRIKIIRQHIRIKKRIYHPQLIFNQNHLTNTPHFRTNKIYKKTNITNPENQSDIHDYDNYINPRRFTYDRCNFHPEPRKDYRLFLVEKDLLSFS